MRKNTLLGAFIAALMVFPSCKDDINQLKDTVKISISTPRLETVVAVQFVDAKTDEVILKKKISLKISGKNANDVFDNRGKKVIKYTVQYGLTTFIIDPKVSTEAALKTTPVDFILNASCPGYSDFTQRIVVSENKLTPIRIKMVQLDDLPAGVSKHVTSKFATATNGIVNSTSTASLDEGNSTVTITKGTILKDENGNPLSGNVSAQILFYNPASEDALEAFPGGLDVQATRPDGTVGDINFMSAGVFDINLTAGGKTVKTFEGGAATIKTILDPAMVNPKTSKAIVEGDNIELWSMDKGSGKWKYEKMATVKKAGTELYLEESIAHLSYWNWDWFNNSCYQGATIEWTGEVKGVSFNILASDQVGYWSKTTSVYADPNDKYNKRLTFLNVPQNRPTTIKFRSQNTGYDELVFDPAQITIDNMCELRTYPVKISYKKKAPYRFDLDMNITITAPNSQKVIKVNTWLAYRPENGAWNMVKMVDGKLKLKDIVTGIPYYVMGSSQQVYGEAIVKAEEIAPTMLRITLTPTVVYSTTGSSAANMPAETWIVRKPIDGVANVNGNIEVPQHIADVLGM
ncbi:MAG: hypothetical protein RL662_2306 [Bacteroidota bacterium]|jgi:hypothetical protein